MSVTIKAHRGTTVKSPQFFTVNEELPKDITLPELESGIENGIYTLEDLSAYTFEGAVRKEANSQAKYDLVFEVTENRLTFKIPVSETDTWPNCNSFRYFDIKRTEKATGDVDVWIKGRIHVMPTMTHG